MASNSKFAQPSVSPSAVTTPRRTRRDIVRANDMAIRAATLDAIVDVGWDEVALTSVAKRAKLTVGAVYARAENKPELGNSVWTEVLKDWLQDSLASLLVAAHQGDPADLIAACAAFESDDVRLQAAVEFLVASLFDDALDEVVGEDARTMLRQLLARDWRVTPEPAKASAHATAGNALLLALTLGRMLSLRSLPNLPPLTAEQAAAQVAMCSANPWTGTAPQGHPVHFLREVDDLDETQAELTEAVIRVVGSVGYRRATIARMGRAAGIGGGSVLSRFQDKAHLVAYAACTRLVPPLELWINYGPEEREFGGHLSRAMWVREVLRPVHRPFWMVNLELARMAMFLPELTLFQLSAAPHHYANLGVMFLGAFGDDLHDLPYAGPFSAGFAT